MTPESDEDDKCPDCSWEGDMTVQYCPKCQKQVDAILDFLIAARVSKMPPQGQA